MAERLRVINPGWYVIRRGQDVACLYHSGGGWWAMCGRNRKGLPPGWTLGPSLDHLLDIHEDADKYRPMADPRTEIDG